jgi:hypothetical protein
MTQIKMTNTITLSKHNSLNTQMYKQSNTQSLPYICHKGTRRMDHSRIFVGLHHNKS